jgi:hypothetical protein
MERFTLDFIVRLTACVIGVGLTVRTLSFVWRRFLGIEVPARETGWVVGSVCGLLAGVGLARDLQIAGAVSAIVVVGWYLSHWVAHVRKQASSAAQAADPHDSAGLHCPVCHGPALSRREKLNLGLVNKWRCRTCGAVLGLSVLAGSIVCLPPVAGLVGVVLWKGSPTSVVLASVALAVFLLGWRVLLPRVPLVPR